MGVAVMLQSSGDVLLNPIGGSFQVFLIELLMLYPMRCEAL